MYDDDSESNIRKSRGYAFLSIELKDLQYFLRVKKIGWPTKRFHLFLKVPLKTLKNKKNEDYPFILIENWSLGYVKANLQFVERS